MPSSTSSRRRNQSHTMGVRKTEGRLKPGRQIGPTYVIQKLLGAGTEGEVYQVVDVQTGILRAAKTYYAEKDPKNKAVVWYAQKLNKLRHCNLVLQYHHTQMIQLAGKKVLCLISEFCDGLPLETWVMSQRGQRLHPYIALHVLYQLVLGLEQVHATGEYHADVHWQNILINPRGVGFDIKLVDFYNWGKPAKYKQQQDILDTIRVFYECLGGHQGYGRLGPDVRYICVGMQSDRILARFPSISTLRLHLENFDWQGRPTDI